MGGVESNLAVASLCHVSDVEKQHCFLLRSYWSENVSSEFCSLEHPFEISAKTLEDSFLILPSTERENTDHEIIRQLFVMYDRDERGSIDYKDLLVSLTYLIKGTPSEKLLFAFEIYDEDGLKTLSSGDLRKILHCLNRTAMYFGDQVLTESNLKEILHEAFRSTKNKTAPVDYNILLNHVMEHSCTEKFLRGWGTAKFGDSMSNS